jgi:predicted dienelactone hydrolase
MAKYSAGYAVVTAKDARRDRPILIDLWYPAESAVREAPYDYSPGFGFVAKDAASVEKNVPIVLLSHGAFGAARNYSWIAEHLARNGYVVAGISHFRESFIFGPETIDPNSALQPWLRAQDCSYALDHLLGDRKIGRLLDDRRVGAIGHSSGGATVLELAGAVLDLPSMQRYCLSEGATTDKGCVYAREQRGSRAPHLVPDIFDNRVKVVVAFDPALGPGHTDQSLRAISIPAYIVGAVDNDFLPYEHHAGRYAKLIQGAKHTQLTNGEGHFVFLNEGQSDAQANGVALYKDRNGVSRAGVHEALAESVLAFLDSRLMVA